jgi:predicted HAD superfamily Cof-like phosphohydrolase
MTDITADVAAFRRRFELSIAKAPRVPTPEEAAFRVGHLQEELDELDRACGERDIVEIADALIDLIYVAAGSCLEWGIPFDNVWSEVQRSNMEKIRATSENMSKRGSTFDVVKPAGWVPPNIEHALSIDPSVSKPILQRAHEIIDLRSEEKERQYGPFDENCDHAAAIASIMQCKEFTASDVAVVLMALKLARHRRSYKQDTLLDAVAYLGALDNMLQQRGDDR